MRIPIRTISIATSAFWVFLILFSASAIYSMRDFQLNLGQPQVSTAEDNQLLLSFPVSVVNTGLYDVARLNVSMNILDEEGSTITGGTASIPAIDRGQTINTTYDVRLNVTQLLQTHQSLFCNDSELTKDARISMLVAQVIPVQFSWNSSMPWGAPLYGLTVGAPQFAMYNATHSSVKLLLSFENHAFFDLTGSIWLRAYSGTNAPLGQGQTYIQLPQHCPYQGNLEVYLPLSSASFTRLEVSFITTFFQFELEVSPNGG